LKPAKEAVPATNFISAKCKFTDICVFARPLAELVVPPTMRHQAETSSAMIAELWMSHRTLARQFDRQRGPPLSVSGARCPWVAGGGGQFN
jgi:hypothetical protein